MNMYKILITTVSALLFVGCSPKSINFYTESEENIYDQKEIVKLYIDGFGNIYPETKGISDFNQNTGNLCDDNGSLYTRFVCNKELCLNHMNSPSTDLSLLCDATKKIVFRKDNLDPTKNERWIDIQTKLWQKKAKEIYIHASRNDRNILFLIHGFNTSYHDANKSYSLIRKKIKSLDKKNQPIFVEVYWNGYKGFPVITRSWGYAQSSGPLAGFQMRQLFKALKQEYISNKKGLPDLMFTTHSSGAFVAGSLLGNPYSVLPHLYEEKNSFPEYNIFRKHRSDQNGTYPIPNFPKIRLGMIAAATPANTFTGDCRTDKKIEGGILSKNTELIFTINWKDEVLKKYLGLESLSITGASGSGQSEELYCKELYSVKNNPTKAYDLSKGGLLYNGHGVVEYLERDNIKNFFKAVLGKKINDDKNSICKSYNKE